MKYYAGLDLHKSMSVIVVKTQQGEVVCQGRVGNDSVELQHFFDRCSNGSVAVALEATTHYTWMYDTLEHLGHEVHLAHPLKVRAIASARIKTDRIDAGILCDLLRGNLLPTSYVPPQDIRDLREILRHRMRLVRDRTKIKNRLSALLAKVNQSSSGTDPFGAQGRRLLSGLPLPSMLAWQRDDCLEQMQMLDAKITRIDRQLRTMAKSIPDCERLRAIPGIGVFTALVILAEIGDIRRFPSAKHLVGYAGLAPGLYQSGDTRHGRGITRLGSRHLRWVLVEASWHLIRRPGPLRQTYLRLSRGKGHGKAAVAVARKLLVGIYSVLKDGAEFAPQATLPLGRGARTGD